MSNIKQVVAENEDLKEENALYKRYIQYLRTWYHDHSTPEYEGMEPVCFEEFCQNEAKVVDSIYDHTQFMEDM